MNLTDNLMRLPHDQTLFTVPKVFQGMKRALQFRKQVGFIKAKNLLACYIENNKALEISYRVNNDVITVDKALGNDTKRSLESVLNCFLD